MNIDWISAAILAAAYIVQSISSLPLVFRHAVMALGMFAIAGWRLSSSGGQGLNLLFVGLAVIFAVQSALQAVKASRV
jgi:hypothetical protein